jgi:hypothetical protein
VKHPNLVDLITTKQNKLRSFIDTWLHEKINEHSMLEVVIHGRDQKMKGGRCPPRTWSNMSPLGKDWGISIWFPNFPQLWYSCWSYLSSYSCWYYWLFYLFSKFASIQRRRWTVKEKTNPFLFDSFSC